MVPGASPDHPVQSSSRALAPATRRHPATPRRGVRYRHDGPRAGAASAGRGGASMPTPQAVGVLREAAGLTRSRGSRAAACRTRTRASTWSALFDVLEHLDDDAGMRGGDAPRAAARRHRGSSRCRRTAGCGEPQDEMAHHCRRYVRRVAPSALRGGAGLERAPRDLLQHAAVRPDRRRPRAAPRPGGGELRSDFELGSPRMNRLLAGAFGPRRHACAAGSASRSVSRSWRSAGPGRIRCGSRSSSGT